MTPDIFLIVFSSGLAIVVLWLKVLLRLEEDKNTDLQKENSRMIKRYLSLQSKLNTSRELLRKKKELLEVQDKLLKDKNIES